VSTSESRRTVAKPSLRDARRGDYIRDIAAAAPATQNKRRSLQINGPDETFEHRAAALGALRELGMAQVVLQTQGVPPQD
jgi:hypothetical protein